MKIRPEHYAQLRAVVLEGMRRIPPLEAYRGCHESVPRIHLARDRDKRYRWDALHAAGQPGRDMLRDDCLYGYLDDDHIDTALRAIVREVAP